jgi:hypothetical protein
MGVFRYKIGNTTQTKERKDPDCLGEVQKKTEIIAQLGKAKPESSCGDVPRLISATCFTTEKKLVCVSKPIRIV